MQNTVAICFCSIISPMDIKYHIIWSDVKQTAVLGGVKGFLVLFVAKEHVLIGMLSFISCLWAKPEKFHTFSSKLLRIYRKSFLFSSSWFCLSDLSCQGWFIWSQLKKLLMCTLCIILISVYLLLTCCPLFSVTVVNMCLYILKCC